MPWYSSEDFVRIVNCNLLPIHAGLERCGEVCFVMSGTRTRKFAMHRILMQEIPHKHESDDECTDMDGDDDKRKRNDDDGDDLDGNKKPPAQPPAKKTKTAVE